MYKADVVIIGSGPAGAAAAITCAQKGLKAIIIEANAFPRHRPGETLHPGIESLLVKLDVWQQVQHAQFLRHRGIWVKWDRERHFVPYGTEENSGWYGIQAWRSEFDNILLKKALSMGVKVHQPCRAIQPIIYHNRVAGVITSKGEVLAPLLIDATGSRQWLAKKLNLQLEIHSPTLIARYGYVIGECPTFDENPAIIANSSGWTWTAKIRPSMYQWTRLSFSKETSNKKWIPKELSSLESMGNIKGADMTWRIVRKSAGLGYFLTGDAAVVLDPASSHGVLKAIMSGMLAGHLVSRITKDECEEKYAIQSYCQWIEDWFKHDVEKLNKLYSKLNKNHRFA